MARNLVSSSSPLLTEEEYLVFERTSDTKHEYLSGRICSMAGASREHNLITLNIAGEIRAQVKGKPCETYAKDMRVRVPRTRLYTYPDVVVVCGDPLFIDDCNDALINPALIIEVLSPTTEAYDRGEKFRDYRSIESFSEYVLIAQNKMSADHFVIQNGIWTIKEVEQEIRLITINCILTLAEIYDRVELGTEIGDQAI